MSLTKKFSSMFRKKPSEETSRFERVEQELAALRARLRSLEERRDALVVLTTTTTTSPNQPGTHEPTMTTTTTTVSTNNPDFFNIFTPPGGAAAAGPVSPTTAQQKKTRRAQRMAMNLVEELAAPPTSSSQLQLPLTPAAAAAPPQTQHARSNALDDLASLLPPPVALPDDDLGALQSMLGGASSSQSDLIVPDDLSALTDGLSLPSLPVVDDVPSTSVAAAAQVDPLLEDDSQPNVISLEAALAGLAQLAVEKKEALIIDFADKEDINIPGLRRGKKKPKMTMGKAVFENEDSHAAVFPFCRDESQAFFGVFDGFAGKEVSRYIAEHMPIVLAQQLKEAGGVKPDLESVLSKTFAATEAELLAKPEFDFVGSTCTAAFLWKCEGQRYLQVANVGDSNAYLCRGGKAILLNVEHKVVSAGERARLRQSGFEINDQQSRLNGIAVARALGIGFVKTEAKVGIVPTPSISPSYTLSSDDTLLIMASDGLWDIVSGQQACDLCKDEADAAAMAQKLLHTAVSNINCHDNVTVMVVRL